MAFLHIIAPMNLIKFCEAARAKTISPELFRNTLQAAVDNGDILEEKNHVIVISVILPLIDTGVLTRSRHIDEFESMMKARAYGFGGNKRNDDPDAPKDVIQTAHNHAPEFKYINQPILERKRAEDERNFFRDGWRFNNEVGTIMYYIFAAPFILPVGIFMLIMFAKTGSNWYDFILPSLIIIWGAYHYFTAIRWIYRKISKIWERESNND
jgi:hypothetical protein